MNNSNSQKSKAKLLCQKDYFSLPKDQHYLNCAFMSPLSNKVQEAGIMGVQRKANPSQISAPDFFTESNQLRELFAKVVNADANRVALIPAVSYGINTVAQNLKPQRGQNIVLLHEQFPSNVYAWHKFVPSGVEIKTVYPPKNGLNRGKEWNTRILEAITVDTAIVAMPQVHWTDGTLFDLEVIGKRARDIGAAFIIDATQSVGAYPFDTTKIKPDALIVGGYKTMMGPYGLGYAYYGERFDGGKPLEDSWIARAGSEDFSRLVDYQDSYAEGAVRYDVGERSNPILLPMAIAAVEQVLGWGIDNVQNYCQKLTRAYIAEMIELGFVIEDENWRGHHLFGVRLPARVNLDNLKTAFVDKNISVSVRGDAVRVAPNVYNDEEDMQALLDVLKVAIS